MAASRDGGKGGGGVFAPQEKCPVWQEVVAGQGTQREMADRWGIDRSTVVHTAKLAGRDAGAIADLAARADSKSAAEFALPTRSRTLGPEIEVARDGGRAGGGTAPVPGKGTLGLSLDPSFRYVVACGVAVT